MAYKWQTKYTFKQSNSVEMDIMIPWTMHEFPKEKLQAFSCWLCCHKFPENSSIFRPYFFKMSPQLNTTTLNCNRMILYIYIYKGYQIQKRKCFSSPIPVAVAHFIEAERYVENEDVSGIIADRQCSDYVWVIQGATYIKGLTVVDKQRNEFPLCHIQSIKPQGAAINWLQNR